MSSNFGRRKLPLLQIAELGKTDARDYSFSFDPLHPQRSSRLVSEIGADGIHVGQDDLSVAEARRQAGGDVLVGKSTHSLDQAIAAERKARITSASARFSPHRPSPITPRRPAAHCQVSSAVHIPQFCIGGINEAMLQRYSRRSAPRRHCLGAAAKRRHSRLLPAREGNG